MGIIARVVRVHAVMSEHGCECGVPVLCVDVGVGDQLCHVLFVDEEEEQAAQKNRITQIQNIHEYIVDAVRQVHVHCGCVLMLVRYPVFEYPEAEN